MDQQHFNTPYNPIECVQVIENPSVEEELRHLLQMVQGTHKLDNLHLIFLQVVLE